MIVFNHNIIFNDEPELHEPKVNTTLPSIEVTEIDSLPFIKESTIDTPWIEMSLQQVCYHRWQCEEDTDVSFSWALEVKALFILIIKNK